MLPADRSRVPSVASKFLTLKDWKAADERLVRNLWKSERAWQHAVRFDAEGQKMIDEVNDITREFNRHLIRAGRPPIEIVDDPTQPKKK